MDGVMKKIFPNYDAFIKKADCFKIYAGSDVTDFVKTVQAK